MSYRARASHQMGEAVKNVKLEHSLCSLCALWLELPFLGLNIRKRKEIVKMGESVIRDRVIDEIKRIPENKLLEIGFLGRCYLRYKPLVNTVTSR